MHAHSNILLLGIAALLVSVMVMGRANLVTSASLVRWRRYAVFAFFAISAVFTPPDALSQIIFALALIGLYEVSIWCVRGTEGTSA